MTGGITVVSYPSRFIKLTMFLESNAEGSLRLPSVGVEGVVVTRDVVDGAAQFLLGGFVLGVYEHRVDGVARLMEQVYSMRLVCP